MATIAPPDPQLFPTSAAQAMAWLSAIRTSDIDREDVAAVLKAVHLACRSDDRTDFILLRIADLAGRMAAGRCPCCDLPLAEQIIVAYPGDLEEVLIDAVVAAAQGADIDDRITALQLTTPLAHKAFGFLAFFELHLIALQPDLPR